MKTQVAQITNPVIKGSLGSGSDGGSSLGIIMGNLYNTLIMVGALATLLYLAWGGINWITAGGDKAKVEGAREKITNAVVGMVAIVGVIAVSNVLSRVFGFDLLNPVVPTP
jgi:hypothetical protein